MGKNKNNIILLQSYSSSLKKFNITNTLLYRLTEANFCCNAFSLCFNNFYVVSYKGNKAFKFYYLIVI